jgi:hypothetical protein
MKNFFKPGFDFILSASDMNTITNLSGRAGCNDVVQVCDARPNNISRADKQTGEVTLQQPSLPLPGSFNFTDNFLQWHGSH